MMHFCHHWLFVYMPFTTEYKIKNLFKLKCYNAKVSQKVSEHRLEHRQHLEIVAKGMVYWDGYHHPSSGRQLSARTADNVDLVDELVL